MDVQLLLGEWLMAVHTRMLLPVPDEGPDFLTTDERKFFAYMAEQRFRTVNEMDPEKRDAARARWRELALWFDPTHQGHGERVNVI